MKRIFIIDWSLIPTFILTVYTGIQLHIAESATHEIWHNWAVAHTIVSILFTIAVIFHIKTHWNWFKSITKSDSQRKKRITIAVSVFFVILVISGIVLLIAHGTIPKLGQWHFRIGIIATILFLGHIIKRIPILKKSLNRTK